MEKTNIKPDKFTETGVFLSKSWKWNTAV